MGNYHVVESLNPLRMAILIFTVSYCLKIYGLRSLEIENPSSASSRREPLKMGGTRARFVSGEILALRKNVWFTKLDSKQASAVQSYLEKQQLGHESHGGYEASF